MAVELSTLLALAATVGFAHTLLGPDHYLPFVAMARAGQWSRQKTLLVTVSCGFAHILGSVILGILGVSFGINVLKMETVESIRGGLAGWLLVGFGVAYFIWGIRRAVKQRHPGLPAHPQPATSSITTWILFTIFLFGPCEPLIPLLMYPAAQLDWVSVVLVSMVFGLTTVVTMTAIVLVSLGMISGTARIAGQPFRQFAHRYGHALAGFVVLACGMAVKTGL